MNYTVRLKNAGAEKTVKASNELEARAKYCEEQGFNYRVFANKLEVEAKKHSSAGKAFDKRY